ncbi:MAG TPA: nicotinate-nucleotide adenylyltransferase [Pyrinomonadaceae bacterium]|nr:nicotinate-nucleotide adenylyltransferase [Pyrinomonadaceae bacterium]
MDRRLKRIAIYGGTFDPVHLGHLETAKHVAELFDIDELLFVPAQHAPHKLEQKVTAPLHRYAMLALATQDSARLKVSTFELEEPDRRYTVDTLAFFQAQFGTSARLFFLMGSDSWLEITSWREWEQLMSMASHIVVTRPGYPIELGHIKPSVAERIVDLQGASRSEALQTIDSSAAKLIFLTDIVRIDVSATEIRQFARADRKDDLLKVVPPPVADYILKYTLYKNFE